MGSDWNELAGKLRSELAARNWREAGAVVWHLRQLNQERYTLELEHYTNQQVGQGGRGVALETEQRLEAVRQWAREMLKSPEGRHQIENLISDGMGRSFEAGALERATSIGPAHLLDWEGDEGGVLFVRLRSDMRDVLWSVLQSHPEQQETQDAIESQEHRS